ncbi:hypothetical protein VP01_2983g3 [Puccinia sorghi]|uniref:Uncharacterized protein n=1 Tax=Puccinia sorghi TaxID=27349 RepID=A0A0L6V0I8_9BASI|nr:hypothetical protein VP01_2983g3 [Puccinia sorghi]
MENTAQQVAVFYARYIPKCERKNSIEPDEATLVSASVMLNPGTQIFISVHLTLSPQHHSTQIQGPSGDLIHGGIDQAVADEVRKGVYRTVYVTGIFWNFENRWDSYVSVVNCSVGRVTIAVILMQEDSTPYALREEPKKRFNLNNSKWKPHTRGTSGGRKGVKNGSAQVICF